MSLNKLPSGRIRVMVRDPATNKRVNAAHVLGLPEPTFPSTREGKARAKDAEADARRKLLAVKSAVTVGEWRDIWISDPLYRRPKESTNIHNRERVRAFVEKHRDLPIGLVDDLIALPWAHTHPSTVPALRAMFNDAASAKAGRLVQRNPFASLGISKGRGRRDQQPPSQEQVQALIEAARKTSPYLGAWLQVACYTGMRPGELDALRWESVNLAEDRIWVREQFNAKTRTFTLPKNNHTRYAPLTDPAREALMGVPRVEPFCFIGLTGRHWTPSARAYHWKAVKASVGYEGSLYLATRHYAGWWMVHVLGMNSEDVGIALGHRDGGELVRVLYGHRDHDQALDRVVAAARNAGKVIPLRAKDAN